MKKYIMIGALFASFIFPSIGHAYAAETNSESKSINIHSSVQSAILMEQDTGEILYEQNVHETLPPASMTKIMTLLLIMEALEKEELQLDETIRISEYASSMGGSQIFLAPGEEMTVEDLLKGIAIASANDASVALAERIAGSEEAFVQLMNEKVEALNLENTKFQNSSGLPAKDHYSTAYDMAVMAQELLKYETITDYTSIYEDYLREGEDNEFWLVNTNKLVRFYDGVDGLKTGFTNEAKYCLTATAKRDDMRVIAVVMGAESVQYRNQSISAMLDYAFNQYETVKLYDRGDVVTTLDLLKAEQTNIPVVTNTSVSTLHKKGMMTDELTTEINMFEELTLPIHPGDPVGTLIVKDGETILLETPLTTSVRVDQASYFTLLKRTLQNIAKH